ncbi:MAG: SRPBCC family protein [Bacteriovoracia bacterium]
MANPLNLPLWAHGLANSKLIHSGDEWITDSPMGKVKVKFTPDNSFGVLDHDVTLPSGDMNHNPLRVAKNSNGSEVIFTLYRRPQMTDEEFKKDADSIEKDLMKLKSLLEIDKS